jgi:hypothetical protein
MTREEIVRLARDAGFAPYDMSVGFSCNLSDIERFAALVAACERERILAEARAKAAEAWAAWAAEAEAWAAEARAKAAEAWAAEAAEAREAEARAAWARRVKK